MKLEDLAFKKRKNRYICNNFREIIKEIIINTD